MTLRNALHTMLVASLAITSAACEAESDRPSREELQAMKTQPADDKAAPAVERVSPDVTKPLTGVEPDVPQSLLDSIAADAAERGKTKIDNVRIVAARRETWPNGAMGCPVPGEMYTQMLTSGYHVIASVGLQKFDYRAGENGRFILCESPLMKKPVPAQ